METADDDAGVAASLTGWLERLTFVDRTADQVTDLVIDAAVGWGQAQGWRVYRRAASIVPLPPPYENRHSVVDVACARPAGRPIVVEVDRTDRRRTLDKLVAEAGAGRVPIWVRWGTGRFAQPPAAVHLVFVRVTSRPGPPGSGRLHSRVPTRDRPAPVHSSDGAGHGVPEALPIIDIG